jgi:hypothetical protein
MDQSQTTRVAAGLLDLLQPPEVDQGAPARGIGRQAGVDVRRNVALDVVAQLGVERPVEFIPAPQPLPPGHAVPPSAARITS